ncbi:MAG: hypothetical protein ABJ275_05705 [Maricaulaceae bacterium]
MIVLFCGLLAACQAESVRPLQSDASTANTNLQTAPLVRINFDGFNAETTVLRFSEGQTVTFSISSTDTTITNASLRQTGGPTVNFGEISSGSISSDGDLMVGTGIDDVRFVLQDVEGQRIAVYPKIRGLSVEFVVPSVTQRTDITFQFQSSNATQTRTRSIPIIIEDDSAAITLTGQVSKGLVSNTRVELVSVDGFLDDFLSEREVVDPVQIDETGTYTFTLLPATDFEELLLYEIEGDGADMVCDAPQGCNEYQFGDTFEVEDDLDLRAYIPIPQLGSTQTVNVNILTTLTARSAQQLAEGFERVDPEDVSRAQTETANLFGFPNQDFTRIPFVDVTRPITSNNETAIRAAMIGAGVLGAAFAHSDPEDDDEYLDQLEDFIDDYEDGLTPCRDTPSQPTLSFEDIMIYALDAAQINGSQTTQNFFAARLAGIRSGSIRCTFMPRPGTEQ